MISTAMNNARLETLIHRHADVEEGRPGYWKLERAGRTVLVLTDESHDRMRIITPVAEVTDLSEEIWLLALTANFDRALDARYAVNGDHLWSAFIHPLSPLTDQQFIDGLQQVTTLADNFGTTFSSGSLAFGGATDS